MEIHIILCLLIFSFCSSTTCAVTKNSLFGNVYKLFDFLQKDNPNNASNTTKSVEEMTVDELGVSRGQCPYEFLPYISYKDAHQSHLDDEFILHLLPSASASEGTRRPPIMVKCLPDHPSIINGNNTFRFIESVQELVDLLKPIGNNTKRYQPGSCVLVFFYTPTCIACALAAMAIKDLPYAFKTLPVAAIDAYKFPSFNTEFGIVALPTLMLFHQGRPVVKYRAQEFLNSFITRHTGLKPVEVPKNINPLAITITMQSQTDYVLILAWLFIVSCAGFYFSKSRLFKQIVEMIKRNWRESEAQLEHAR